MRFHILFFSLLAIALALPLSAQRGSVEVDPVNPMGGLLATHQAWKTPPYSVQIDGQSTRGPVAEPVRITVTLHEQSRIEYGERQERVQVASPESFFDDDGMRIKRQPTPSGFTQLDVSSVFLLARLSQMPVKVENVEEVQGRAGRWTRIAATTGRTELHYGQYVIEDRFDLYAGNSGLLAGISRSFYQERPQYPAASEDPSIEKHRKPENRSKKFQPERPEVAGTLDVAFSDYRQTQGVLLPYRIDRYLKGSLIETIVVDRYTMDVPVSSSLFTPRRPR